MRSRIQKSANVKFSNLVDASLRQRLFQEIQNSTSINENGSVSWSDDEIDQYVSILGDAFVFPDEISRNEISAATWRGIINARKSGCINDNSVLREIQKIVSSKLSESRCNFSMWTRVSYIHPVSRGCKKFRFDEVNIRLSRKAPNYMTIGESSLRLLGPHSVKDKPGYAYIIASTKARNATQAADKIFGSIEVFQSLFNLVLRPWNIFGSEQRPEAALQFGPYHFLFKNGRSHISEPQWFNQSFRDDYWKSSEAQSNKVLNTAAAIRRALRILEQHPLKSPLCSALLMMNEGMEAVEMSRRTLRYWTALERLFQAEEEKISYDKIIRRATYLDGPSSFAKAKLYRLMRIRNRHVHSGGNESDHHQLVQYLAEHVKSHLLYLLFSGDDFRDHAEFLEMTDLPSDSDSLHRRRRAIDRRERMIETRRHRED